MPESTLSLSARSMRSFLLLCSLLLCNGLMVAAQEKVQKLPKEEKGSPAQIRIPQTLSRGEWPGCMRQPWSTLISLSQCLTYTSNHSSKQDMFWEQQLGALLHSVREKSSRSVLGNRHSFFASNLGWGWSQAVRLAADQLFRSCAQQAAPPAAPNPPKAR